MIIAGTVFGLSFAGVVGVLFNKARFMSKGRAFFTVDEETDQKVRAVSENVFMTVKKSPKIIAHTVAFLALRYSILIYEKAKKKIYPKIAHLVEAVKGKDIPKNRGLASFFLANISKDKEIVE